MFESLAWLLTQIAFGFVNAAKVIASPSLWPSFTDMESVVRLVYYGASQELLFVLIDAFLVLLALGLWRRKILWGFVRIAEAINNAIGRTAAWAALLMVLQQVMIVGLQRVFRVAEINVSPFGFGLTRDVSWYAEELKLYNAAIVTLCAAYTFIQGGHVRVDLIYSNVSFRARKAIDMAGSLFFAVPFLIVTWLYGWFFLWRHLIRPPLASNYDLDRMMRVSKLLKWDVETIAFSPNGFDAYFLFKVLLVCFSGLMLLQAVSFFFRSLLEWIEGPESENRGLDRDSDRERERLAVIESRGHGA